MKDSRHFIVIYIHNSEHGGFGIGSASCTTTDGSYVNCQLFRQNIEKQTGYKGITIINVIESSESDVKEFFATKV